MMKHINRLFVWVIVGALASQAIAVEPESDLEKQSQSDLQSKTQTEIQSENVQPETKHPQMLLINEDEHPTVTVSWVADGQRESYSATLPYTAPTGGDPIGKNVKSYVTLGGTRIETGAGHPKGAIIRLGITKVDGNRSFFAGIDPGTEIEFSVTGVRMNQPVKYHEGTGMMHLKYALGDLKACALPGTARNQYLLSDPQDTLGGRVKAGVNATPGALDGQRGHGSIEIEVDEDDPTLVTMRVRVPYGLLRHLQDPWKSALPGTFFEPTHMHAEAELIPVDAKPLDRDPIFPETNPKAQSEDDDSKKDGSKKDGKDKSES